jgi:hypothetical protein
VGRSYPQPVGDRLEAIELVLIGSGGGMVGSWNIDDALPRPSLCVGESVGVP